MKNFIYVAVLALVMTACGANASKTGCDAQGCDSIVATDVVPAVATDVIPAAAPSAENDGKVATDVIPAEGENK